MSKNTQRKFIAFEVGGPKSKSAIHRIIERLRVCKKALAERDRMWGCACGKQEAAAFMSYQDLDAISKLGGRYLEENQAYARLKYAIDPDGEFSEDEFNEFYFNSSQVSSAMAVGFIEGAISIFSQVKGKV